MERLVFYILIASAFGVAYGEILGSIFRRWFTCFGAHGMVLAVFSVFMVWTRKDKLRQLPLEPSMFWGTATTAIGCLLLVISKVTAIMLIGYVAITVTIIGLVLCVFGAKYLRVLAVPIGFWVLMFPIYSELWKNIAPYLDGFVRLIIYHTVRVIDNEVSLSNLNTTVLLHGGKVPIGLDFSMIPSGFDQIVAVMGLAFIVAYYTHGAWVKKLVIISYALVISILANLTRLVVYSHLRMHHQILNKNTFVQVMLEPSFVFFVGILCMVPLAFISGRNVLCALPSGHRNIKKVQPTFEISNAAGKSIRLLLIVLIVPILLLEFHRPVPAQTALQLYMFPKSINGWHGDDATLDSKLFQGFSAPVELRRVYRNHSGREVSLYVGYFPKQEPDAKVNHWRFQIVRRTDTKKIESYPDSPSYLINKAILSDNEGQRIVWFWYLTNGKISSHHYVNAFWIIWNWLAKRDSSSAIVFVSAELTDGSVSIDSYDDTSELVRAVLPLIRSFL